MEYPWLDRFVRQLLDGIVIPQPYKKAKRKPLAPMADNHVLPIAFSAGRAAFTTMMDVEGHQRTVSFTQFGLRIWVGGNWTVDAPTVAGDVVRASIVKVIEEIRVHGFISPQQAAWLTQGFADESSSAFEPAPNDDEGAPAWITELQQDHGLIVPGAAPGTWVLSPYGAEIRRVLLRATQPPSHR